MQLIGPFLQHLKLLSHFLAPMVSDENQLSFKLCSVISCVISPAAFDVFLFLVFMFMMQLLELSLFYLWLTQLFEPAQLYLLLNMRCFHLFFAYSPGSILFSSSTSGTSDTWMSALLLIVPQITEAQFSPVLLLLFRFINSIGLFSNYWFNLLSFLLYHSLSLFWLLYFQLNNHHYLLF